VEGGQGEGIGGWVGLGELKVICGREEVFERHYGNNGLGLLLLVVVGGGLDMLLTWGYVVCWVFD